MSHTVTAVPGDGQVQLSWGKHTHNPGSGQTSRPQSTNYRVFRDTDSNISWDNNAAAAIYSVGAPESGGPSTFSYTDTDVTNGVTYYYLVVGYRGGSDDPSDVVSATPEATGVSPGTPTNLSGSRVSDTSLSASWSAPSTGTTPFTYRFAYWEITAGWLYATTTSTSITLAGLVNGGDYLINIRAENSAGNSSYLSSSVSVPLSTEVTIAAPSTPTGVSATAVDHDSIIVSWSSAERVSTYEIRYRIDGGSTWPSAITGITSTSRTINGLNPSTTYEFQVRARNSSGTSNYSSTAPATTNADTSNTPASPTGLFATVGNSQANVSWDNPNDNTITRYEYRISSSGSWVQIIGSVPNTTTVLVVGLTNDISVTIYLRAVNDNGNGSTSSISVTPNSSIPSRPERFDADSQSSGVVITWDPPSDNGGSAITGYEIWRLSSGGSWAEITTVGIVDTYTDQETLTLGQRYRYVSRARNKNGTGTWSVIVAVIINPELPSAPRRFQADSQSSGVVMSWDVPADNGGSGITGYEVWRHDGSLWTKIEDDIGVVTVYTDTTSTLIYGNRYDYVIRASNTHGEGEWSQSKKVFINYNVPSPVRRLTVDSQSSGVVLSWLVPRDTGLGGAISGYNIWRQRSGYTWVEIVPNTNLTATTYTDTDTLVEGDRYFYNVRAINAGGGGEWSQNVDVIINLALPSAPRQFQADAQSSGVVMSWSVPVDTGTGGDITGYAILRRQAGATAWTDIVANTDSTDTSYTDTSTLAERATYDFAVRAINASGRGEWSQIASVIINPNVPSSPRRLVVTETSSGIELEWLPPIDSGLGGAITGYRISRRTGGIWSDIVANTRITTASYIDTSTLSMGWHFWSVRAINASGVGEWSEAVGVNTATNVPSQPLSLIAIEVDTGIKLTWDEPANTGGSPITGYKIWRHDGSSWVEIVSDTGNTDTEYIDTGVLVQGSGAYFYRVNAITTNGDGDFSAVATVQLSAPLVLVMPTGDPRVFGNWWVLVRPTITNPNDDILMYEWTQTGGLTISQTDTPRVYVKLPVGTTEDQSASLTFKVTNTITNKEVMGTIGYTVVAEPPRNSMFLNLINLATPGIVWYGWNQPLDYDNSDTVGLADSRFYRARSYIPIKDNYVITTPAYVALTTLNDNGSMYFRLSASVNDANSGGESGPQLTGDAKSNLGLALRLPDGTEYKWEFNSLTSSDPTEPHLFSASSVSTAGQANNAALRSKLSGFWNMRLVLVDRVNTFIDWANLETIAIEPSVSINVVDTKADSGKTQTISGLFDDFQDDFKDITLSVAATNGTLGGLQRDYLSGFWNIPWTAPIVSSGTMSTTITATVMNSFGREVTDTATITTRAVFNPTIPAGIVVDQVVSIQPEDKLKDVTNIVKVPVRQFNVTDEIELWSLQNSVDLEPGSVRTFIINYPDDAAPRSHLAVNNWAKLKLEEDQDLVFGPDRNTFGTSEGAVEDARRERNKYAIEEDEWLEEYKNSSSLMVRLLGASRSGAIYEAYVNGDWTIVEPRFPDYAANSSSDGNGNDRRSNLELEVDDGGNTRKIIVKNTSLTDTIYLTELRSRGRVIQEIQKTVVEIRDEASIDKYEPKDYTSESQFLSTIDHAHEYGTHILYLHSGPTLKTKVRFETNNYLFLAYSLQLSDRVALTRKGETEDYFVEAIEHIIEPGFRHDMQVTLSAAPENEVIILGTGPPLGTGVLGR